MNKAARLVFPEMEIPPSFPASTGRYTIHPDLIQWRTGKLADTDNTGCNGISVAARHSSADATFLANAIVAVMKTVPIINRRERILHFGCSTNGAVRFLLSVREFEYAVGVDTSVFSIKEAAAYSVGAGSHYFAMDCALKAIEGNEEPDQFDWLFEELKIPYPAHAGKFDIVLLTNILESRDHLSSLLEKMKRFMKPTGHLVIIDQEIGRHGPDPNVGLLHFGISPQDERRATIYSNAAKRWRRRNPFMENAGSPELDEKSLAATFSGKHKAYWNYDPKRFMERVVFPSTIAITPQPNFVARLDSRARLAGLKTGLLVHRILPNPLTELAPAREAVLVECSKEAVDSWKLRFVVKFPFEEAGDIYEWKEPFYMVPVNARVRPCIVYKLP